jgi:hypothetical protein
MKIKRNLSGIYFRYKNPNTDSFENWCFEDLSDDEQTELIKDKNIEWTRSLVKRMADTINRLGEQFDIITG